MSEQTTFSIGVSKKYLSTILDCVIRDNDLRHARQAAVFGATFIWIAAIGSALALFVLHGDPRDVAIVTFGFLILGFSQFWEAVFFRISRGYLMGSESVLSGFRLALIYLDGMAVVRKCQEAGTEPPKGIFDAMQKVQKRYGIPHFNQDRDGADEIILTERLTKPS